MQVGACHPDGNISVDGDGNTPQHCYERVAHDQLISVVRVICRDSPKFEGAANSPRPYFCAFSALRQNPVFRRRVSRSGFEKLERQVVLENAQTSRGLTRGQAEFAIRDLVSLHYFGGLE